MAHNTNSIIATTLFFFWLLSFLVPTTSALACDNSSDCRALLKFKAGITSDPDGHLQDWNEANSFCNWTGVTCHRHLQNRVIALELSNMHLQGSVSPYLSNLSLLTTLSLIGNSFSGEIPTSLGILSQLEYLNTSSNMLQGSFPASLHGCQNLKFLDLAYNKLSGAIPDELGWMKNLNYFAVSVNSLTGVIPASLSNLTEMRRLELAENNFTGKIPAELGALTKLEIMYLHLNFLEGAIPASLSNCTALREFSLIGNLISGEIPSELGIKLQNLQKMYLLNNKISGKIPVTLSNLSQMTLLDLSINRLQGEVPAEFGKLKNLEILYLHSNDLVSTSSLSFLAALTNCSNLLKLNMASCFFSGSLPDSIGGLSKKLFYFNLLNNYITGEIPESIGNLSSIVSLSLRDNFIEGTIPATLGKLSRLQRLYLGRNKLHGSIPDDIGQIVGLGLLEINNNSLSGSIPSSLGNLSQLRYLYLSQNRLSGNIPEKLTQCSLLILLDLSFNDLQGSIPTEIGRLVNLALSLNLSNNNLNGEIPASMGNLVSALAIDLSKNRISGTIPSSLEGCISLGYLNLSNNMLEGTIPEALKQIKNLEVLDLAFNNLAGNFPAWLANESATTIKTFNLSYNRLTGEVPNNGRLKDVNSISLMGNGFCGGSALMNLPPCQFDKKKRRSNKWIYYMLPITFACSLLLLMFVASCVRYSFRAKPAPMPSIPHGIRTFTEMELDITTLGFNEANLLGKGSFGSVYKGTIDEGINVVAIKVLDEEFSEGYKSLMRESQILSEIKHRNLVRMVGLAWNSKFKALVLEYVANGSLQQHLYPEGGECQLKLRERMSIAIDIANALEYLHEGCSVQVLHCDLKPENVLLDNDMVAHVADFGVGKFIFTNRPPGYASTTDFLRGSVGYIPPEYGQNTEVTARGDVYSFGVMLLELITRRRPTSEIFAEGLDLRKWVGAAFPEQILDVVDVSLKQEYSSSSGPGDILQRLEQWCLQILDAGMACTDENPHARPSISSITKRLHNIWKKMQSVDELRYK